MTRPPLDASVLAAKRTNLVQLLEAMLRVCGPEENSAWRQGVKRLLDALRTSDPSRLKAILHQYDQVQAHRLAYYGPIAVEGQGDMLTVAAEPPPMEELREGGWDRYCGTADFREKVDDAAERLSAYLEEGIESPPVPVPGMTDLGIIPFRPDEDRALPQIDMSPKHIFAFMKDVVEGHRSIVDWMEWWTENAKRLKYHLVRFSDMVNWLEYPRWGLEKTLTKYNVAYRLLTPRRVTEANDEEYLLFRNVLEDNHRREKRRHPIITGTTAYFPPCDVYGAITDPGVGLNRETLEDYFAKNECAYQLDPSRLSEWQFIERVELEKLPKNDPYAYWDVFHETYPEAGGHIELSRAGLNAERSQALVYIRASCGALAGEGRLILLERSANEWQVKACPSCWDS